MLFSVLAGDRERERAECPGLVVGCASGEGRVEAERAVRVDVEAVRRGRVGARVRGRPRHQVACGRERAAGLRGCELAAGAAEEAELELVERKLRVFIEAAGDLACFGVRFELARDLHDRARLRVIDHYVRGQEGVEGVFVLGRQEDGPDDRFVEQRRRDFDRADPRGLRAGRGGLGEVRGGFADGAGAAGAGPADHPTWASEQASKPFAADGLSVIPAGISTVASLSGGVASLPGSSVCGTVMSKSRPVGESAAVVSGLADIDALKCRRLQPVTGGDW